MRNKTYYAEIESSIRGKFELVLAAHDGLEYELLLPADTAASAGYTTRRNRLYATIEAKRSMIVKTGDAPFSHILCKFISIFLLCEE